MIVSFVIVLDSTFLLLSIVITQFLISMMYPLEQRHLHFQMGHLHTNMVSHLMLPRIKKDTYTLTFSHLNEYRLKMKFEEKSWRTGNVWEILYRIYPKEPY